MENVILLREFANMTNDEIENELLSPVHGKTSPGIGPGNWDSAVLARNQELKQSKDQSNAVLYRLYTENTYPIGKTQELIGRYFDGFTLYLTTGVYLGIIESGLVIEVVATTADLQAIVHLAGDIKVQNYQSSVLVTWAPVSRLDV